MKVVYEDNHIIIVAKQSGEIVQGDKTGDTPLADLVKAYIKEKYQKPGEVFLGVVHRLDRPVFGLVVFARTSKALSRLNRMFAENKVHKTYWAVVERTEENSIEARIPTDDDGFRTITHWLIRNEKQNKSYAYDTEKPEAKKAVLRYRTMAHSERYTLIEVQLLTGRHHQIRCQLAKMGHPIKGDLKYGTRRSNPDGSISLVARRITFTHPVSQQLIDIVAPLPDAEPWPSLANNYL